MSQKNKILKMNRQVSTWDLEFENQTQKVKPRPTKKVKPQILRKIWTNQPIGGKFEQELTLTDTVNS